MAEKGRAILVAGGSGFLGRRVVALLEKGGHTVIIHNKTHKTIPTHADMIINCVGIIREDDQTFREAHVDLTQSLIRIGKKLGVGQFVQVSALGVENNATEYQRTKLRAEKLVEQSGLPYVILRPSMMFGSDDRSINRLRAVCRTGFFPLFGNGRVQPVSVDTVAKTIVAATEQKIKNRTIEIGGPEIFTYKELVNRLHPGVRTFKLPSFIAKPLVILSSLFKSLPTKEQVKMLQQDNVVKDKFSVRTLGRLKIQNSRLK